MNRHSRQWRFLCKICLQLHWFLSQTFDKIRKWWKVEARQVAEILDFRAIRALAPRADLLKVSGIAGKGRFPNTDCGRSRAHLTPSEEASAQLSRQSVCILNRTWRSSLSKCGQKSYQEGRRTGGHSIFCYSASATSRPRLLPSD